MTGCHHGALEAPSCRVGATPPRPCDLASYRCVPSLGLAPTQDRAKAGSACLSKGAHPASSTLAPSAIDNAYRQE